MKMTSRASRLLPAVFLFLFLGASGAAAEEGRVLKVVDGDTFLAEIDGKAGPETIEVHLRCADAPVLDAPFGAEARTKLQSLLDQPGQMTYKVMAYCGSETCVDALVYFPDETVPEVPYVNTRMIEAGLARNNACRGDFAAAEAAARAAGVGIWSSSAPIAFAEPEPPKPSAPKPSAPASAPAVVQPEREAPAIVRFDRAERTVTLKSSRMALTRAIKTIDAVSPMPVNIYLQDEQYLAINLDKAPWYEALGHIVENADLKQVNMDGNIDLYSRLFYYKHVAPYLKVAGNVGVYMNAGGGDRPKPAPDDGVTRYVFINEFENSAEVAQQYRETKEKNQHGFIQVHEGAQRAPVSEFGRFERSDAASAAPRELAGAEPERETAAPAPAPVPAPVKRKPLQPYGGERVASNDDEKPALVAAAAPEKPVDPEPRDKTAKPVGKTVAPPAPAPGESAVSEKTGTATPAGTTAGPSAAVAAAKPEQPAADAVEPKQPEGAVPTLAFTPYHGIALVLIIVVLIAGCIALTRSAGARASVAERPVDPEDLLAQENNASLDLDSQVDRAYEEEIFDDLDHVASDDGVGSDTSESLPGDAPAASADDDADLPGAVTAAPEDAGTTPREEPDDAGNFSGQVEEDRQAVDGPQREPRKVCLFEVRCLCDGSSFAGIGLDISPGGLFIDSREHLEVGKVLELEFKLDETEKSSIRCRGAVTWYNRRPDPIKPDYPNGFGVRFVDMDAATKERLMSYLDDAEEGGGYLDQIKGG